MAFTVSLTAAAARDLEEIYDFISGHDSPAKADRVLDRFAKIFSDLANFPERGVYPKELLSLGLREYREIFFKPYRVIYRVIGNVVFIYLIADGRREMQFLLERRLLA